MKSSCGLKARDTIPAVVTSSWNAPNQGSSAPARTTNRTVPCDVRGSRINTVERTTDMPAHDTAKSMKSCSQQGPVDVEEGIPCTSYLRFRSLVASVVLAHAGQTSFEGSDHVSVSDVVPAGKILEDDIISHEEPRSFIRRIADSIVQCSQHAWHSTLSYSG